MHSTTRIASRGLYLVSLLLLLFISLNAQIKIKERVEINPLPSNVISNSVSSSPATVHLEFTVETNNQIRISGPSTLYGYHTISTDVCTFDEFYYYQVSCFEFTGPVEVPYHFTATVGTTVLFESQGVWYLGPSMYGYSGDRVYLKNPFGSLRVSSTGYGLCEGGQSSIDITSYGLQECSNADHYLLDFDPITLTVTHGQELVRLYLNGVYANGNSLSFLPRDYNYSYDLGFSVNEILPDGFENDSVTIQISAGSINKTISNYVYTCLQKCVMAVCEKSPLTVGDTTLLRFVYTWTGFPVPEDKSLDIWIQDGFNVEYGEYGTLLVGGSSYISFDRVTQPIYYIAPANITEDSLVVLIVARESSSGGGGVPSSIREKDSTRLSLAKNNTMNLSIQNVLQAQGIQAECQIGEVTIKALHHFKVTIVPDTAAAEDTVAFTEGATLFIQAQDKDSVDIEYEGSTALKLSLTTNEEYGTFINANGDTLKTTPVELIDVLYSDAKAGRIKFAAVKKNPDSLVTCKIRVEKQSDPTKLGERDAIVVEQTLKIVMEGDHEVRPIIPPSTVLRPLQANRKPFTVQWTRNGKPFSQQHFRLETDYVDGSGGHDHITPRRTRNNENYGHFYLTRATTHLSSRYEDGITQADGKERFDYIASIFGDRMKIRVETTIEKKKKFLWDTVSVVERVRDLFELSASTTYELVGNPNNHSGTNDPCRTPPPTSLHFENHYGTQNLLIAIQRIAALYDSLNPGIRLRINDMSLQYGGRFDANNNWTSPHGEHRIGINADIGITGINPQNQCPSVEIDLRTIIFEVTGIWPLREYRPPHFHIYVRSN